MVLALLKKLVISCGGLKAIRARKSRCVWLVISLSRCWIRTMRRFGAGLDDIQRQRIRHSFCAAGIHAHSGVKRRAKHIVFQFLVYQYGLNMFVKKFKLLMKRITFIQQQHKRRQHLLDARTEVLENQWHKIVDHLAKKAQLLSDSPTKELLNGIVRVPQKIKQLVLKLYL